MGSGGRSRGSCTPAVASRLITRVRIPNGGEPLECPDQ
jgi:hypothetical protein